MLPTRNTIVSLLALGLLGAGTSHSADAQSYVAISPAHQINPASLLPRSLSLRRPSAHAGIAPAPVPQLGLGPDVSAPGLGITDLGGLGHSESLGLAISHEGVLAGMSTSNDGSFHAIVWRQSKQVDLGNLGAGWVSAVNDKGHVVGQVGPAYKAFFASRATGVQVIGALPGDTYSAGNAINDNDEVVGFSGSHAVVWDQAHGMQMLPPLSGDTGAWASAINNRNQIVGYSYGADGIHHPVIWNSPTAPAVALGTLGGYSAGSDAINEAGQVVGDWSDPTTGNVGLFTWDSFSGLKNIGGPTGSDMGSSFFEFITLNSQGTVTLIILPATPGQESVLPVSYCWTNATGFQMIQGFYYISGADNQGDLFGVAPNADGEGRATLLVNGAMTQYEPVGGDWTQGFGVNQQGDIAGVGNGLTLDGSASIFYNPYGNSVGTAGFLWSAVDGLTEIGSLGGDVAIPHGINDYNQIVGESCSGATPTALGFGSQWVLSFFWDPIQGMLEIPSLGGPYGNALALNNADMVTGWAARADFSQGAYLYNVNTDSITDLLAGVDNGYSAGNAINNRGQVTGAFNATPTSTHAFLWDPGAGLTDMGDFGGAGNTTALALNDSGEAAGNSVFPDGSQHAFCWTVSNGFSDLGNLGGTYSTATGINAFGQIVGQSNTASGIAHGTLYTTEGSLLDLNTLLPVGAHWMILAATQINGSGQITGYGYHRGSLRAFLITPRATLAEVSLSARSVKGGQSVMGTVRLSQSCPYDLFVSLQSANPAAGVPGIVKVPAGAQTSDFTVTTSPVKSKVTGQIRASFANLIKSATLTVTP